MDFYTNLSNFWELYELKNNLDSITTITSILRSIDQAGGSKEAFLGPYFEDKGILQKDILNISRVKELINYVKNTSNINKDIYVSNGRIPGSEFEIFNRASELIFLRNFIEQFEKFNYNAKNGEIYFKTRPQFDGDTGIDILCKPIEENPKYNCVGGVANLYEYFPNLF